MRAGSPRIAQLGDAFAQVVVLGFDLLPLERGERAEAKVEDRVRIPARALNE